MTTLLFTYGYPPADGGVEAYSAGLAEALWHHGERVLVLAPRCPDCDTSDRQSPFPVFRTTSILFLRELSMLIALVRLIPQYQVTRIVATVWLPCGALSSLMRSCLGTPYFLSAHGSELLDTQNANNPLKHLLRKRLRWLKAITFRNARGIFAVSHYTRELLISEGVSPDKISVIPNGVDPGRFRPLDSADRLRARHKLADRRVILTVARLDDYKGQDTVIRALPQIVKHVPHALYLVVGRGPEHDQLRRLAIRHGVSDYVIFAGYVPAGQLVAYYNVCDVFVMVSRQNHKDVEGFGLVYLEANACGKPVIGGDSGGVRDAIVDGQTGLLVDPQDDDMVAACVIRLLLDPAEARRLGENGRRRAEGELDWAHVARRMLALMEQPAR